MSMHDNINTEVRSCITTALLDMMYERSLTEISICDIAKRAGVARVTFYRNFSSKEDVLVCHMNELSEKWYGNYMKHPEEDIICSLFHFLYSIRDTLALLYRSNLSEIIHRSFYISCGPRREHSNEDAYRRAILYGMLTSWCDEWFRRGMKESPEQLAAFYLKIYNHEITLR